jgi:hypothetical protein
MDINDFTKRLNKDKPKIQHPAHIYVAPLSVLLDQYPTIDLKQKMKLIKNYLERRVHPKV